MTQEAALKHTVNNIENLKQYIGERITLHYFDGEYDIVSPMWDIVVHNFPSDTCNILVPIGSNVFGDQQEFWGNIQRIVFKSQTVYKDGKWLMSKQETK